MNYIWKLDSTQPALHKTKRSLGSEQVTIQTFRNTRGILEYIYLTYMKENLNIFTCSETDLKPASEYCHESVSNEQENTTQIAQYLYHTVLRAKRIKFL